MADNRTHDEKQRRLLLNAELKSMLGPCMISFSIPLFIPGLTITLVAFTDETGFSKYGPLHVIGIVILTVACVLLVFGCVLRCTCRSKVFPFPDVSPHHKVTTHEKPKKLIMRTLTRDKLPPLVQGPQPGGSSVARDNGDINEVLVNHHSIINTKILSESEDETSSEDETEVISTPKSSTAGLPRNNFMKSPIRHNKPATVMSAHSVSSSNMASDHERTKGQDIGQSVKTTLTIESEVDNMKMSLTSPSFTNIREGETESSVIKRAKVTAATPPDTRTCQEDEQSEGAEPPALKPIAGWVSRQSHDKLSRGSKTSSETPSSYSSSDVADPDDDDCDDVTLNSRNCSTVPEIADLDERDDSVEVDRFNNVWRGESQNSVEISSVLSHDDYSEESLSVMSKEQLEISEPTSSRGQASSDSAMESGGDHSRALSGDHSRALSGDHSRALSGDHSRTLSGDHSRALSGDHSRALPGDHSRALSGDHSRALPGPHRLTNGDLIEEDLEQPSADDIQNVPKQLKLR